MMEYVAYIRVSTKRQTLGLDAQLDAIQRFVDAEGSTLLATYVEQESGVRNGREQLGRAMAHCRKGKHTLLVAKLDRVSRRMSFIANLLESNINLKVAEMPGADTFQLHIYAALAQQEASMISKRTKDALAEKRKQGVELGRNGKILALKNKNEAKEYYNSISSKLMEYKDVGMSLNSMALKLTQEGVKTRKGGNWSAKQVSRALNHLAIE